MKSLNGVAVVAAWGALAVGGSAVAQDADCNVNGIPDATEIAQGLADDCNANGIPDACESAGVTLSIEQAGFGNDSPLEITFADVAHTLSSVRLTVAVRASLAPTNSFVQVFVGESLAGTLWVVDGTECPDDLDAAVLVLDADIFNQALVDDALSVRIVPIGPVSSASCRFSYARLAATYIASTPASDCIASGRWDGCDIAADPTLDCDGNGSIDSCEIASTPDLDCDNNGILDTCDTTAAPNVDCDGNGIGDACEIALSPGLDCNGNGSLDHCELFDTPSLDSNDDGTLDDCSYAVGDLTLDGVIDGADIGVFLLLWGTSGPLADLDQNGEVNGADLGLLLLNWGEAPIPPTILETSPPSGFLQGGDTVTISGLRLNHVESVAFGGVPAASWTLIDRETISVVTPSRESLATVDVVVATRFGSASFINGFLFTPVPWATILEYSPDPAVVPNQVHRDAITSTTLPWRVRDNISQVEMLLIPAGTFMRGCAGAPQAGCGGYDTPYHQVTLTQDFYLGRYEVTQSQWASVMGSNPSQFKSYSDSPSRPVEKVSWNMIQGFEAATSLRLPTDAEWEYACRAGTTTAYNNGSTCCPDSALNPIAWWQGNANVQTHPVGQKLANAFGLHDMHGNVYEWVEDWRGTYPSGHVFDPPGPTSGYKKVIRGCSWFSHESGPQPLFYQSSWRAERGTGQYYNYLGFRAARTP